MKKPTRYCVTFPHEMVRTIKRIARTEKVSLAEAVRILVARGALLPALPAVPKLPKLVDLDLEIEVK